MIPVVAASTSGCARSHHRRRGGTAQADRVADEGGAARMTPAAVFGRRLASRALVRSRRIGGSDLPPTRACRWTLRGSTGARPGLPTRGTIWNSAEGHCQREEVPMRTLRLRLLLVASVLAVGTLGASTGTVGAYGKADGPIAQIEFSANCNNPDFFLCQQVGLGGVWVWIEIDGGAGALSGDADVAGSGCGHVRGDGGGAFQIRASSTGGGRRRPRASSMPRLEPSPTRTATTTSISGAVSSSPSR